MRYRLTIEYDGSQFVGWQRQREGMSVQQAIDEAALNFDKGASTCVGAGRTDAGVHALGQVAHIDLSKEWHGHQLLGAFNYHLRNVPVVVTEAQQVDGDFHARFSAIRRTYQYRILARAAPSVLNRNRVWHRPFLLDVDAMSEGAQYLLGRHDFTTFRDINCQAKSSVKTLDFIAVDLLDEEIRVTVHARSFLHRQVRSMVGVLERVGAGAWSPIQVEEVLQKRDRSACAAVAPARGLYLVKVDYGEAENFEQQAKKKQNRQ